MHFVLFMKILDHKYSEANCSKILWDQTLQWAGLSQPTYRPDSYVGRTEQFRGQMNNSATLGYECHRVVRFTSLFATRTEHSSRIVTRTIRGAGVGG